jgi:hypothetical protein
MAADTILAENRLHVSREIHFGGCLRKRLRNQAKARNGGSGK